MRRRASVAIRPIMFRSKSRWKPASPSRRRFLSRPAKKSRWTPARASTWRGPDSNLIGAVERPVKAELASQAQRVVEGFDASRAGGVRQRSRRQAYSCGKAITVVADHIHAGLDPGGLSRRQQPRRLGPITAIGLVQFIQQQQIAQVKQARADLREIQILPAPEGIGAARVKKSAAAMALLGHDIGVGSRGLGRHPQMPGIDLVPLAVVEDLLAQRVAADQTRAGERE